MKFIVVDVAPRLPQAVLPACPPRAPAQDATVLSGSAAPSASEKRIRRQERYSDAQAAAGRRAPPGAINVMQAAAHVDSKTPQSPPARRPERRSRGKPLRAMLETVRRRPSADSQRPCRQHARRPPAVRPPEAFSTREEEHAHNTASPQRWREREGRGRRREAEEGEAARYAAGGRVQEPEGCSSRHACGGWRVRMRQSERFMPPPEPQHGAADVRCSCSYARAISAKRKCLR